VARKVVLAVIGAACAVMALLPAVPAGAAWAQPAYVRSIGGRGEAGVYAWGIAWNPSTDEILVGDYWNFKVRRYDRAGNEIGAFFRSPSLRKGQPYSLAVNPLNGDIWVPEISDGKSRGYIARYDKFGTYLGEIHVNARYIAWIYIDKNGYLWVADSHYWNNANDPPKIRKYSLSNGQELSSFGTYGTSPNTGQIGIVHGLGMDASGNIYAADAVNRVVHVYTQSGQWLRDFGGPGNGVGQFTGDLRGLAIDTVNGWVYVVDAEAAEIEKFDLLGNPLGHWGSEGSGPGQYADGGRQVTVDGQGHVWVADYGNFRFFEYAPDGTLLQTAPAPSQPPAPGGFAQVRDVAVSNVTGAVWGADSWNNRFQKFTSDGSFLGAWGIRNSHPPYGMDYPRGIAVDPVSGNIWVASTRDHFIRVYDSNVNSLFQVGSGVDSSSTGSFRWPMDIEFYGGKAYIGDYNSGRVKILDASTGAELSSFSRTNNGVAVDPVNGNIYVLSWSSDKVYQYNSSGTTLIRSWGSTGSGNGQFQNPWDIDIVNGTVYVTDAQLARVQAFDLNGNYLGQWGSNGTGAYRFNNPSGITHDALGNIYIADAGNDRIQVFSPSVLPPSGDVTSPTVSLTYPGALQTVPPATVQISGVLTDAVGIANAEVAVRNMTTGLWWNAKDAVWGAAKTWNLAPWFGATTAPMYAFGFVGVGYATQYQAQARATDTSGNVGISASAKFWTDAAASSDVTPPTATITQPGLDEVVSAGPVALEGQANDDVGVTTVEVAIKDRNTSLWWNPATSSWGSLKWIPADLTVPGATSTTWSYTWSGGSSGGSYYAQVRAKDAVGNENASPKPFTRFTLI
jgi:DNA-binding beta-propeller fold protein YncE